MSAARRFRRVHVAFRVGLIGVLLAYVVCSFRNDVGTADTRDHSPLADLPEDARDIHWFRPGSFGPNTCFDFDTSEQSFEEYVASWKRPLLRGPIRGATRILIYDLRRRVFESRELGDAISWDWSEEDRGVHLVYDRTAGRAFVHSHSR